MVAAVTVSCSDNGSYIGYLLSIGDFWCQLAHLRGCQANLSERLSLPLLSTGPTFLEDGYQNP